MDFVNATVTCPICKHQSVEAIPTDACLFFYECHSCKTLLKPLAGDCCVFCSYADHDCPSRQR
ncbi:MAG: GDCCVxC domain-containing (seleno)protein [Candidatus Nanopelagicaceae bacterium]|nr:GDCCVxC domain-containing (seleno)protein [Candidatus Nanopelagicaceae bacterium]